MKIIQPGQVNGFNQDMSKATGADYKSIDFLSGRNMTWTSTPPAGDGLKRMGIDSKNSFKTVGSTVLGGGAATAGSNALGPLLQNMMFEGG